MKLWFAETRAGRRFVVVIDEAQNLSDAALEMVRLLTNFETSRAKLMQIVLSGQPQLSDKLMQAFSGATSPAHFDHSAGLNRFRRKRPSPTSTTG